MRGRRPAGPAYVEHLHASSTETRRRLKVILQTMTGELRLSEACELLKVCPQRFHQLREEAMRGALAALEPRPAGRPPLTPAPAQEQVADLEKKLATANIELSAAEAREEIALVLPRVIQEPPAAKKKRADGSNCAGPLAGGRARATHAPSVRS
jgi:hypothetical protein